MKVLGFPWTIRTRLTLLYGGAFFVAGVILISVMYFFLAQVIERQFVFRLDPPVGSLASPAPGGDVANTLQVVDLEIRRAREGTLQTMLIVSVTVVGMLTIAAAAIGWLLAGQALQPLRNITATARRVADRSLHERIALTGPRDEIKDLADTLDAMFERLDRSFDSQRRFVANASHELRTPLTITRTLIEVALLDAGTNDKVRQLGNTLLTVNQRHEKLTDGLLTLASSDQRTADFHPLDLGVVASHVAAELLPLADRVSVRLETDIRPAMVLGDAFLIERLIQNLVENAIQYNLPENGWVRVETMAEADGITLVVENTGPIVPAYEVPGLFEPFRRLASTERLATSTGGAFVRGAGLGLSIVRSIAEAHSGSAEAAPRPAGGLVVRVRIPAAP